MRYSPSLAACTLAVALLTGQAVVAEPIPPAVAENIRSACAKNHGSKPWGAVYCMCMTLEMSRTFSLQALATLEGESAARIKQGLTPQQVAAQTPEIQRIERLCRASL